MSLPKGALGLLHSRAVENVGLIDKAFLNQALILRGAISTCGIYQTGSSAGN
jgi:hypothetical protein